MTRKRGGALRWWLGGSAVAVLVLGLVVLLNPVIWAAAFYDPFDANFDPLIQAVRRAERSSGSGQSPTAECCFKAGEEKVVVLQRLQKSKFEPESPSGLHVTLLGQEYSKPSVVIYSRSASRFPCLDMFLVIVEFDAQDRVLKAHGDRINAACV